MEKLSNLAKQNNLLNPDLFYKVADNNQEFAQFLLQPILDQQKVDGKVIFAHEEDIYPELENPFFKKVLIVNVAPYHYYLILIPENPEETELNRNLIRRIEVKYYENLYLTVDRDITMDMVVFSQNPFKDVDEKTPVVSRGFMDLTTNTLVHELGVTYLINNKYRDLESDELTEVIGDLAESDPDKIKSPLIKKIHQENQLS